MSAPADAVVDRDTSEQEWRELEGERRRRQADVKRELRLRADPPRVTRVSRKALVVLGSVVAVGLGGAFIVALEPRAKKTAAEELYTTGRSTPASGVTSLPRDYSAIPKLGPPLPGDFARPMLKQAARDSVPVGGAPSAGPMQPPDAVPARPQVDPIVQQRQQARAAALRSTVFVGRGGPTSEASPPPIDPTTTAALEAPTPAPTRLTQRREAFLASIPNAAAPPTLTAPASPNVLQAGSMIAAALVTGIRSDLPGQVVAQVTEPVYDSATGRTLLIPQGARLIGTYDSDLAAGQSRLLLAWNRLILPDGRSLDLARMPAADAMGQAGLQDRTDYHWSGLLRAALISTLLGVGAQTGSSNGEGDIARALRDGASDSMARTGRQVVDRELGRAPTITIRPGYPVRAMLTRDLDLAPYEPRP